MTKVSRKHKSSLSHIIPMVLIGAGLIVIGLVAAKFITNDEVTSDYSVVPSTVNFPVPEISLDNLQGETISISDYTEHVVLINNWATWCPPCRAEMPTLARYYKEHKDDQFMLIGIEAGDPANEVARFVEDYKLTFPILLDPGNKALIAFRNDGLPSSYVVDRNGTVVLAWTGPISKDMLEKYVTPLLEQ